MRFILKTTWSTLCLLCLLCQPQGAWDAAAQVYRGTQHPTRENIPEATDPSLIIDVSDNDQWEEGPYVPDTTGMKTATFGREDGELYELLARVRDIATDGHGSIFILDADSRRGAASSVKTVHVIDTEARYLGSIGSVGEGPGEFMHPSYILVDNDGKRILVAGLDHEIDVFERLDRGVYRYVKSWNARTMANDACIMRNHVYLLAYDQENGRIIHKYTADGEYVMGFGEPYKSTNPMIVEDLSSKASLSCVSQHGVVGHVWDNIPVLTAYSEHGDLLWRLRVEGIKPTIGILETILEGRPVIRYTPTDAKEKGRGDLTLSKGNSDGYFYLGVSRSLGDEVRRNFVFKVDALSGTFAHIGHGYVSYVMEEDLIVRLRQDGDSPPQVDIWSRQ